MVETCGHPTKKGPCTMRKGHEAKFHRHREYNTVEWIIRHPKSRVILESGQARVPLNYAMTRQLDRHGSIVVECEVGGVD